MAVSVVFSTLMVLLSGSKQDLIDLWNQSGGVNDPGGNKHELDLPVVISDGNFRSAIVDDWQIKAFDSVSVYGMNLFGDVFWETEFNVTGSTSFYMDNWLLDSYIVRSFAVSPSTQTVIYNDQMNYRLRIFPTPSTDKSWFAVSNTSLSYGPLPLIFVPRSVSTPFTNPIFSEGYLGCWQFAELVNVVYKYTDAAAMSPTSCVDRCWDSATVALLANGNECYCADRNTTGIDPTEQTMYCYLVCPGSSSDLCGGFSTTEGNAYHVQGSKLPGHVETVRLFQTTLYNIKTIQIDVSDIFGTSSTPVYITKIILNVTGQLAPEYTVWYNEYNCSESGGMMKFVSFVKPEPTVFQANGSAAAVDILRVRCIQLRLNETALEVDVDIWGPNVSSEHIKVPVLAIRGKHFVQVTTTSTSTTSTTSTSTTTTLSTTTSTTTTAAPSTSTSTTQTPTTSTTSTSTSSAATTSSTTTTLSATATTTTSTPTATNSTASDSPSTTTTPSTSTTASTSTITTSTHLATSTKSTCFCPCNTTVTQLNLTTAQLQERIVEIQRRLAVNVSKLSSTIRKLTSAEDKRVSAVSIGYLGVGIMVSILASIVFIDSAVLFRDIKMLFKNIRNGVCPHKGNSNL